MSVYMEPLIDDLLSALGIFLSLMICSVSTCDLPENPQKGFGHTIELQRQTSECMFGTTIPCMTCRRVGYSVAGVFTESFLAQCARQL